MWKLCLLLVATLSILCSFSAAEETAEQEEAQANSDSNGDEGDSFKDFQHVRDTIEYSLAPMVPASWYQARLLCNGEGKQLANVNDETDYKNIVSYLLDNDLNYSGYWLAGTKLNGPWLWSNTTERITVKKWANGEPRRQAGSCMEMKANYRWYASRCFKKLYAICEKNTA